MENFKQTLGQINLLFTFILDVFIDHIVIWNEDENSHGG